MSSRTESSNDEASRVMFDDTKDERTTTMDDGFEVFELDKAKEGVTRYKVNGNSYKFKMCSSKSSIKNLLQRKVLVSVFEEMFKRIEHRLCLRHLYAIFKKKFGGCTLIRNLMMGATKRKTPILSKTQEPEPTGVTHIEPNGMAQTELTGVAQTGPTGVAQTEERKSTPIKKTPKSTEKVKYEGPRKSSDRLNKLKTKSVTGPSVSNDEPMIIPKNKDGTLSQEPVVVVTG
ncbi:hypothetical protein KIW84_046451 [Lathyrus oleraceus]|uniref:Uncharacterized protein n=1 Tax=Pisum sativum TaxID=3888 RepID=A0A9D4XLV6_PEA|nr:hypothetical protein KIW84_046451 [Pisum sativum]